MKDHSDPTMCWVRPTGLDQEPLKPLCPAPEALIGACGQLPEGVIEGICDQNIEAPRPLGINRQIPLFVETDDKRDGGIPIPPPAPADPSDAPSLQDPPEVVESLEAAPDQPSPSIPSTTSIPPDVNVESVTAADSTAEVCVGTNIAGENEPVPESTSRATQSYQDMTPDSLQPNSSLETFLAKSDATANATEVAVTHQTKAPGGRRRRAAVKPRNVPRQLITCIADIVGATEAAVCAELHARQSDEMPYVSTAGHGSLASATQKDKRNIRDAIAQILFKGIAEIWGSPDFRGATVYHIFTEEEVMSSLAARGYTHWVCCGRGKKLLKLGVTSESTAEPDEAN
jgi:hypothetical protein